MAILSFWSGDKKETGQTLSIVAMATYMSVERNYKTLVVDATLDDDTLERCFWKVDNNQDIKIALNRGKLDIASGTEGLMTAVASNMTTPEIISSYTKVVFKNRLDILLGLRTKSISEYDKSLNLYPDLLAVANKFYDLVIVDLPKTAEKNAVHKILNMSDVIMYTMSQNLKQINGFTQYKNKMPELRKKNVIPLLGNANEHCIYNHNNVISRTKDKNLVYINYNNAFLEAASEARVANFFLNTRISKKAWDKNSRFLESVGLSSQKIIDKFEELKYGKMLHS